MNFSLNQTPEKSRKRTGEIQYDASQMSRNRIIPVLLLGVLAFTALVINLEGKTNQTFDGVIVQNGTIYEFYPNAKDCKYEGTPYVLLPNARFDEIVTTGGTDIKHLDRLFNGTWRAQLNGNLSRIGWYRYRKTYWRELSVNFVVDAVQMSCSDAQ